MEKSLNDFRPPTTGNRTMQSFEDGQFTGRAITGVKAHLMAGGEDSLDELKFFDRSKSLSKSLSHD